MANISEEFKTSLIRDLRNGLPKQNEKILVIASKIIFFSLSIQEAISEIVKKNKLIFYNSNNEPYIENACCESSEKENTIEYFFKKIVIAGFLYILSDIPLLILNKYSINSTD
jgi:hypothetical protein